MKTFAELLEPDQLFLAFGTSVAFHLYLRWGTYHGLLCIWLYMGFSWSFLLDNNFLGGRDYYFFVVPEVPGIFSCTQ